MSPWIVSARVDLGLMMFPALLSVVYVLSLPSGIAAPWWVYLFGVLMIDVAHVWASIYRTYLDPDVFVRRRQFLLALPLSVGVIAFALNAFSSSLFWTVMAYIALHHFLKQQVGFSALYRLRQGLSFRSVEARVEKWMIHSLVLTPVIWWHVNLPREFSWFMQGDFFQGLPEWVLLPVWFLTVALVLSHIFFRFRSGLWSPGRDMWAITTAAVWFGGIVLCDGDFQFTLSNVVAHGLPYFVLVGHVCRRKWEIRGRGAVADGFFRGAGWFFFLGTLIFLALIEEGLWDILVWQENTWLFGAWSSPPYWLNLMAVGLLAVPQITHYILDGFIWKMDSDPDLRACLVGELKSERA